MPTPARTFVIKGVPEVIINDYATGNTLVRLLRAVDAKLSFDFPSEKIHGGNGSFPFDTIDKDRTATVSFTNAEFDAGLLAAAMGSTVERGTTAEIQVIGEAKTVPTSTPYTVDLTNKTTAVASTVKVRYADTGAELTQDVTPAVGKYTYTDGTLTFEAGDAGKAILIDYKYTVSDGDVVSVLSNTTIPVCQIVMVNTFKDLNGNDTTETITIYKAKASGKMEFNQSRGAAAQHTLDFEILDPGRPDKKMVDFSTVRPA